MAIDDRLTAAPATPLVVAALATQEGHGFTVLQRVRELAGGELPWSDGMLYPLLHRLHRLGYLTAEWRPSADGRWGRRHYALTDRGRVDIGWRSGP